MPIFNLFDIEQLHNYDYDFTITALFPYKKIIVTLLINIQI